MKRRAFLKKMAAALGLTSLFAFIYPAIRFLSPSLSLESGEKVKISKRDLKGVSSMAITVNNSPVVVINRGALGVIALSRVCTHLGCLVVYSESRGKLVCPCHAAEFNLEGKVLAGPAPRALETVAVTIEGDSIIIG